MFDELVGVCTIIFVDPNGQRIAADLFFMSYLGQEVSVKKIRKLLVNIEGIINNLMESGYLSLEEIYTQRYYNTLLFRNKENEYFISPARNVRAFFCLKSGDVVVYRLECLRTM